MQVCFDVLGPLAQLGANLGFWDLRLREPDARMSLTLLQSHPSQTYPSGQDPSEPGEPLPHPILTYFRPDSDLKSTLSGRSGRNQVQNRVRIRSVGRGSEGSGPDGWVRLEWRCSSSGKS